MLPPEQRKAFLRRLTTMYRHPRFTEKLLNDPYMKCIIEGAVETEADNENEDCANGHCSPRFKQIAESDLLEYLRRGWQIVKELSSGEVIVRR